MHKLIEINNGNIHNTAVYYNTIFIFEGGDLHKFALSLSHSFGHGGTNEDNIYISASEWEEFIEKVNETIVDDQHYATRRVFLQARNPIKKRGGL